ncbi:hypothetical protein BpHYR1_045272 [Brachionus plicatilis]|uniref:Uncharacterized protein n=1 Tax=Brachionus plicatilis TaxID=10195 RepID=A0A3M7QUS7_BRAPC|nr:hypothetical protein BpHYR1_045272 [Brachionus plicatilis]
MAFLEHHHKNPCGIKLFEYMKELFKIGNLFLSFQFVEKKNAEVIILLFVQFCFGLIIESSKDEYLH